MFCVGCFEQWKGHLPMKPLHKTDHSKKTRKYPSLPSHVLSMLQRQDFAQATTPMGSRDAASFVNSQKTAPQIVS